MRKTQRLTKSVLAVTLGSALALTLCATGSASAATPVGKAAPVGKTATGLDPVPVPEDPGPEMDFQVWAGNVLESCLPVPPSGAGARTAAARAAAAKRAAVASSVVKKVTVAPGASVGEVRLSEVGRCVGAVHQQRITGAFAEGPADYRQLRAQLIALGYPSARIHRMQEHHGQPMARIDLRLGRSDGNVAVDVTAYRYVVTASPFGVPASPQVDVTKVRRKLVLSRTMS
ncbi:hypothetical protein [Streptomyces sp. NPDC058486]|uniref:hypothetical protein n=1 Tax=unclassified Streptomyces TaxID=2593676 RepID=UPI00366A0EEF